MNTQSLTKKYSVHSLAKAFGVDRHTLARRLTDAGIPRDGKGYSVREAFQAWTKREANEDARRRMHVAAADLAELTLSQRKGEIADRLGLALADVAIRVRGLISSLDYNPAKSAQRFSRDFEEAQLLDGVLDIVNGKGKTK